MQRHSHRECIRCTYICSKVMDSHISINFLFANSPPLSDINFSAEPCTCIQDLKIALIATSGSLDGSQLMMIVE